MSAPPMPKLDPEAIVDSLGRQPCHKYMADKSSCTFGDKCKFYHGPFTKAMWTAKKKRDEAAKKNHEKQLADNQAAAAAKVAEGAAGVPDDVGASAQPGAKAKAKNGK